MNGGGRRKAFPLGSWCLMSTAFGWRPGLQSPAGYAERCPRSCVKASHGICSKYICIYMKASRDPWLYTWTSGPLLKARAEGVGEALLGLTGKLERKWLWEGSTSVKLVLEVIFSSSCSPDLNTGFASKCWFGSLTSRRDPHPWPPHLAVASQHTPGLWTSLVFVLLWVVLSLTSQILLL